MFVFVRRTLIVHLQRYTYNAAVSDYRKNVRQIVIPKFLTLHSACDELTLPPCNLPTPHRSVSCERFSCPLCYKFCDLNQWLDVMYMSWMLCECAGDTRRFRTTDLTSSLSVETHWWARTVCIQLCCFNVSQTSSEHNRFTSSHNSTDMWSCFPCLRLQTFSFDLSSRACIFLNF